MQKKIDIPFEIAGLGVAAAVIENAPHPVMIKNAQGVYIYINPMFEAYFDKDKSEILDRTAKELWGAPSRRKPLRQMRGRLKAKRQSCTRPI